MSREATLLNQFAISGAARRAIRNVFIWSLYFMRNGHSNGNTSEWAIPTKVVPTGVRSPPLAAAMPCGVPSATHRGRALHQVCRRQAAEACRQSTPANAPTRTSFAVGYLAGFSTAETSTKGGN